MHDMHTDEIQMVYICIQYTWCFGYGFSNIQHPFRGWKAGGDCFRHQVKWCRTFSRPSTLLHAKPHATCLGSGQIQVEFFQWSMCEFSSLSFRRGCSELSSRVDLAYDPWESKAAAQACFPQQMRPNHQIARVASCIFGSWSSFHGKASTGKTQSQKAKSCGFGSEFKTCKEREREVGLVCFEK